jgi:hypothetical protein
MVAPSEGMRDLISSTKAIEAEPAPQILPELDSSGGKGKADPAAMAKPLAPWASSRLCDAEAKAEA